MKRSPSIDVSQVAVEAILELREEYRREMACQIVHDSWHARGFTDSYLLSVSGQVVGYGAVGGAPGQPRDTLKEFFVRPPGRGQALSLCRQLLASSGARWIETQTNDVLLALMLYDCAVEWTSPTILFDDRITTTYPPPGVRLRRLTDADRATVFRHTLEPVGEWGLECAGEIVATGGVLFHYNPPFGDLFMEVAGAYQRRGFGSYLVQELKRLCYESGHVPAARCQAENEASRRTLQRAGLLPCARILRGRVACNDPPPAGRPEARRSSRTQ